MPDELLVLGSASAMPTQARHAPAFALRVTGRLFLIDCGAPVSSLLYQYGYDPLDVQAVFLSHWHMDHVAGLGLFLIQNHLLKRAQKLRVYGPRGTKGKINRLLVDSFLLPEDLKYKLKVSTVKHKKSIQESLLTVKFFKTQHLEKPKHKTHFGRKAAAMGMLLQGPGWRVLYSGDLSSPQELAPYAAGCNLLIHEMTHVKPEAVAEFAEAAQIPFVLLSHIDPQYDNSPGRLVKAFAKRYSGNLQVAQDGTKVQLSQLADAATIKVDSADTHDDDAQVNTLSAESLAFLEVLQKELAVPAENSYKILLAAKNTLLASTSQFAPAETEQVQLQVAAKEAPTNIPLTENDKVSVTLTLDAGESDVRHQVENGRAGLRRLRLLRLQQEALSQGGMLTQADLADLLNVSVRTIRRDINGLQAEGHHILTRGQST